MSVRYISLKTYDQANLLGCMRRNPCISKVMLTNSKRGAIMFGTGKTFAHMPNDNGCRFSSKAIANYHNLNTFVLHVDRTVYKKRTS